MDIVQFIAVGLLLGGLVLLSIIDQLTETLPDRLMLPLAVLGFVVAVVSPLGSLTSWDFIAGGLVGFGGGYTLQKIFVLWRGADALGFGDVKLAGVAGLWVGLDALPLFILVSSWLFVAVSVVVCVIRSRRNLPPLVGLPMGPYLSLAIGILAVARFLGHDVGLGLLVRLAA